jgi:O-antigen ligase
VGSGTLFPWYAVEAKHIPAPGDGRVIGPDGAVLSSAHSLYVAVLAELGVVMLVVLLAIVAILAARAVGVARRHGRTAAPVTTLALAATTVAWFFDTYLTKNFSLSLWWWVVAFSALSAAPALSAEQPSPSASTDPSHSPAE